MVEDLEARLRRAMSLAGYDVARLARETGISYQGIKKQYDGKAKTMSAETAERISKVLGCDKHWLALGEGTPFSGSDAPAPSASLAVTAPPSLLQAVQAIASKLEEATAIQRKTASDLLAGLAAKPETAEFVAHGLAAVLERRSPRHQEN